MKCVIRFARGSTYGSGCIQKVAKSLQSGSSTKTGSNTNSVPRTSTTGSDPRARGKVRRTVDTEDPMFMEFLATSDNVIALDDMGRERKSTESILSKSNETTHDFLWPQIPEERRVHADGRRQTVHASWTPQRELPNDGWRTERPSSAPLSPSSYGQR